MVTRVAIRQHLYALPAGDLEDGGYLILDPLALAAGDRFDPAIRAGRHVPQGINRVPRERTVKCRGYDHEIDIAPPVWMA
jgi:hypothetical protein